MRRGTLLSLLSLTIGGWMMSSNADRATIASPEDPVWPELSGDIIPVNLVDTARSLDVGSSSMTASRLSRAAVPSRSVHGDRVGMVGQNAPGVQDPDCVSERDEIDTAAEWSASYRNACDSVAALARHANAVVTEDEHNAEVWIVTLDTLDFGTTGPLAHGSRRGGDTERPVELVVRQSSP